MTRLVFAFALALAFVACGGSPPPAPPVAPRAGTGAERVRPPPTAGLLDTDVRDHDGRPRGIACATCHGTTVVAGVAQGVEAGRAVHAGIRFAHGALDCRACHDKTEPGRLHLADGTLLGFGDAMRLCSQCHGQQRRDYDHGAHGGMNGSWDLARGGRTRNHCLDCHAAHAPKYPQVQPAPPPRDRGMIRAGSHP